MINQELIEKINQYLWSGGLFNPELANHEAVRDLLIDCRETLIRNDYERTKHNYTQST